METAPFADGTLVALAVLGTFYLAWWTGAMDTPDCLSTALGAKALSRRAALGLGATSVTLGALLGGPRVAATMTDLMAPHRTAPPGGTAAVVGMVAVIATTLLWVLLARRRAWPISLPHTLVGSMLTLGLLPADLGGIGLPHTVTWAERLTPFATVAAGWLLAPVAAGFVAFASFRGIQLTILDRRFEDNAVTRAERTFSRFQGLTTALMLFAHGTNTVACVVTPLVHLFVAPPNAVAVPRPLGALPFLILGAVGILAGLLTHGERSLHGLAEHQTEVTPTRGFTIELATAVTVLGASALALPVGTAHVAVGAVLGVALARSIGALNMGVVRQVGASWVASVLSGACTTLVFTSMGMALTGP